MEELSSGKTLDTSVMKQLTGGEAHISVRPAGAADTRSMLWSAKLITVFNEGCTPKFKVGDDAFTKRMIVVPHRSFFCKDDAAKAAHAGEPLTFDADKGKIEEIEARPWTILAWFLVGIEQYWASGNVEFQVPLACREWAGKLVEDQDDVVVWAQENLEPSPGNILLTLKEAFAHYKQRGGSAGKSRFGARLKTHMALEGVEFVSQSTREGEKVNNFWEGVTLI